MRKVAFALIGLAASLAAAPLLAQTPQAGAPRPGAAPATQAAPKSAPAPAPAKAEKPALIDINSASKEDLDALPGIGEARAEAIIKGRPYKSKDDLRRKKVIPINVYNSIKERIVARQS